MNNIRVQDIPPPKDSDGVNAAIDICDLKIQAIRESIQVKTEKGMDVEGSTRALEIWEAQKSIYLKMRKIYDGSSAEGHLILERYKEMASATAKASRRTKLKMQDILCGIRKDLESCPTETLPPQLSETLKRLRNTTKNYYVPWLEGKKDVSETDLLSDFEPE